MQPTVPPPSPYQYVPVPPLAVNKNWTGMRLFGAALIAIGIGAWWYNAHLAATTGHFWVKLTILGPGGVFGGLLMLLRPDWAGRLDKNSTPAHKAALITTLALMTVASGITFYVLSQPLSGAKQSSVIHWTPQMGTPSMPATVAANTPSLAFLSKTYQLASFNNKTNPMWEFVTGHEDVNNWTTLLTIIDRSDARTRPELDRLAEGVMSTYKSNGAQILLARTMQDETGTAFNYMVAAFDQPAQHRIELNFVKFVLGSRNANIAIYGVRITDPRDYRAKAKEYLDRSSSEVGQGLGQFALPDISNLPRREF